MQAHIYGMPFTSMLTTINTETDTYPYEIKKKNYEKSPEIRK